MGSRAPNCAEWNTEGFFETATVEDVTACLSAGADTTAGSRRVEAGELGFGDTTRSNGAYEDRYSHVGRAGQSLVVEVRYSDLDGRLIVEVESPSGKWFYGATGMQTLSLDETGEYRILVSSFPSVVSGPYTLHIGNGGRTPLYYAGRYNENPAVIEALLAAGADVASRDDRDITPLRTNMIWSETSATVSRVYDWVRKYTNAFAKVTALLPANCPRTRPMRAAENL